MPTAVEIKAELETFVKVNTEAFNREDLVDAIGTSAQRGI